MNRLAGKIAIVTGGASGVGAAICRLFFAEGASVLIADDRDIEDERLSALLADDRVLFHRAALADEEAVAATCAAARAKWGNVNVAVAAAELSGIRPVVQTTGADWDAVMSDSIRGAFLFTKYVVPQMRDAGGGSIIALSSVLAMVGTPGRAAHSAASGAVRSFAKAVACEWVRDDIRMNSIHIGIGADNDPAMGDVASRKAEDAAWGCVFLASEEARFISGAELVIDGGASVTQGATG